MKVGGLFLLVSACGSPFSGYAADDAAQPVVPYLPNGTRADGLPVPDTSMATRPVPSASIRTLVPGLEYDIYVVAQAPASSSITVRLTNVETLKSDTFRVDALKKEVDTHAFGDFVIRVAGESSVACEGGVTDCAASVYPSGAQVRVEIIIDSQHPDVSAGDIAVGPLTAP